MRIPNLNRNLFSNNFIIIMLLLIAFYILIPRNFETGGESWKAWAAAKYLRETGEWQIFSKGPLYLIYLQIFNFFDYPYSIRIEYTITNLFSIIAVFSLLAKYLVKMYALILTVAWIHLITITEGGAVPAGIGFLALYIKFNSKYKFFIIYK